MSKPPPKATKASTSVKSKLTVFVRVVVSISHELLFFLEGEDRHEGLEVEAVEVALPEEALQLLDFRVREVVATRFG